LAFSFWELRWFCVGSADLPLQQGEPSCSADWTWFEPWFWPIVCV